MKIIFPIIIILIVVAVVIIYKNKNMSQLIGKQINGMVIVGVREDYVSTTTKKVKSDSDALNVAKEFFASLKKDSDLKGVKPVEIFEGQKYWRVEAEPNIYRVTEDGRVITFLYGV